MGKIDNLPDEDVMVKISTCQSCYGIVRTSIIHMMTKPMKREFTDEVMEYNLSVTEMSLPVFRLSDKIFCSCE